MGFRDKLCRAMVPGLAALACAGGAQAQSVFPSRTVQLIVPYGAGSSDLMARIMSACLASHFKQAVPVLNKPGANTGVGNNFVKAAAPDGYTLLITSSSAVTDLAMLKTPTFDIRQDLDPVTKMVIGKQGLYVNAASPYSTLGDFLAYAKANPGKVNYGTTGTGSVNHLSVEAMALNAGIKMVHVSYSQGTGAVLTALMTGELQFVMIGMSGAQATLNTGKIRLLSVFEKQRPPSRPDLPTVVELMPAMGAFTGTLWWGFFVPPKTPRDITQKLHADITGCLADQNVRASLKKLGFEDNDIVGNTPDEFRASIAEEVRALKDVVQKANLPLL